MRQILVIILVGLFISVNARFKYKGDPNCVYKAKYSAEQRKHFYPFSIADTIKLVSFRYHENYYPIDKDTLIADSLIETKTLSNKEVNDLTDILFNNFYKQASNVGSISQCFAPRNAILFIDKSGRLKAYELICFSCGAFKSSSADVAHVFDCTQKLEKLLQFFVKSNVTFGTVRHSGLYPGETESGDVQLPPDPEAPPTNK